MGGKPRPSRQNHMQTQRIDITGETFGLLTAVGYVGQDYRRRAEWLCRCRCGKERVCAGGDLRSGRVKACRECARTNMAREARKRVAPRPARTLHGPAKILPLLTPEQRARYEQWDAHCKMLHVYVPPAERLQVLKEIAA